MVENDLEVFSVRVPKALGEAVRQIATSSRRSRNAQIVILLEQAVDLNKVRSQKQKATTLKT